MTNTFDAFVKKEISIWGEDYIFDLIEKGYKPVLLVVGDGATGQTKWSWKMPRNSPLTSGLSCDTLNRGSDSSFLPFR